MKFTLESLGDRLGLAAPQVHIPLRIVIFSVPKKEPSPRYQFDSEEEMIQFLKRKEHKRDDKP